MHIIYYLYLHAIILFFQCCFNHTSHALTRKTAMAPPVKYPARTSAQWLRYSATLTTPTSMARHSRVRLSVGLVRRVPLVLNTNVTYICKHRQTDSGENMPDTSTITHIAIMHGFKTIIKYFFISIVSSILDFISIRYFIKYLVLFFHY